jgi:flagellar hook-associated protein 1 FlgK
MSSMFDIGLTGLNAAQRNLATTSHNISNATTPGYHRQRVELQNAYPVATGDGFIGTGVDVLTVTRIYSEFLESQVAAAQGRLAYLESYRDQIAQIDNLLADPNSGLSPAIEEFFTGVQQVAVDPDSAVAREAMLAGAATIVGRLRSLETRLSEMFEATNSQIRGLVTSVNALAQKIADLNQHILEVEAAGGTHAANDLRDQRDAVISELNKLTGASTVRQADGSINVLTSNGQNLVIGSQALTLAAVASATDPKRLEIGYDTGGALAIITPSMTGGQLGAALAFQREGVDATLNALGRVAAALTLTFNQQHRLGQDLNGAIGADFFTTPVPEIFARTTNAGNGVLSAALVDASALTTSDYRVSYNAGNYTVTRLADSTASVFASLPQTVDGVLITLTAGAPADGDTFLVQPTRSIARNIAVALTDGTQIAAAAPIRSAAALANTGSATINAGAVVGPPPINANLLQPVTITFTSATTFDVDGTGTGNPLAVAYTPGAPISFNGWTTSISGVPRAGDVFTVTPNVGGVSDNRNAALLAGLQTAKTMAGATATYQSAYSQSVANIGSKTRQAQVASAAQQTVVQQTEAAQQSLSGVNLDEEAANLIRYQQMYQASAKLIEIASTLFDAVLDAI